jgi:Holliday junction resolvase RusA-like endonuclease
VTSSISADDFLAEIGATRGGPKCISSAEYRRLHGLDPPKPSKPAAKPTREQVSAPPTQAQLLAQSIVCAERSIIVNVVIDGDPVAKGRPRLGKGKAFTPAKTRTAEHEARKALRRAMGNRVPYTFGDVDVHMEFWLAGRPRLDFDNLAKLVCDAANGIVWRDDAQIREARVRRHFDADQPRTLFAVRPSAGPGCWRPCARCGAWTDNAKFCGRSCR